MKRTAICSLLLLVLAGALKAQNLPVIETGSVLPMPAGWIDKDTGHKIIHLVSREGENRSFYFHNNPFLQAKGETNEKMILYGFRANFEGHSDIYAVEIKK